jgi:hypothetical protein
LAMLIAIPSLKAQAPVVPDSKKFKSDSNYAKYEGSVKKCVAWFIENSVDKDPLERSKIAIFLIDWVGGSPDVTETITGSVTKPMSNTKEYKYNDDLMIAFIGGMTVYELNNPKDRDEVNIEIAGIHAMLEMAKNSGSILADSKAVKKYVAMNNDELAKYVKDCVAKDQK